MIPAASLLTSTSAARPPRIAPKRAGRSRFRARLLNRGVVAAGTCARKRATVSTASRGRAVTCPLRHLLLTGRIGHPPRASYPGSRSAAPRRAESRDTRERYESVLIPSDGIKRQLGWHGISARPARPSFRRTSDQKFKTRSSSSSCLN